ncbi:hypothetical protein RB195_005366 [Necator americanus]|uniref:Uncharacterized protein n=1 Tax=Necator americanus TaxID=51031 RepID=A0ABR1BP17_NECAM
MPLRILLLVRNRLRQVWYQFIDTGKTKNLVDRFLRQLGRNGRNHPSLHNLRSRVLHLKSVPQQINVIIWNLWWNEDATDFACDQAASALIRRTSAVVYYF